MRWTPVRWVVPAVLMYVPGAAMAAEPGVVVAPPAVTGQEADHVVDALAQGVRDGLTDAGIEAVQAPEGCAEATCLAEEVSSGRARAYIATEVSITGSDYAMTVDILDGSGSSVARREGSCEICTYEEAAEAMRALVAETAAETAAELGPPPAAAGALSITSEPAGATVTIDGTVVGATPHEAALDEGTHTIELTLDGYQIDEREVVVTGEPQTLDITLEPARRSFLTPRNTEIIAWSAIGVGAAALVGGITLLVLDNNPVKSNCSGVHVDADGDCEFRYDTLGGGIGLTVTGLAVAGGGVGLLLWNRKRSAEGSDAEVALVPGGLRMRF